MKGNCKKMRINRDKTFLLCYASYQILLFLKVINEKILKTCCIIPFQL